MMIDDQRRAITRCTRDTCVAVQSQSPRAVGMPRSFNAAAMAVSLVTPLCSSVMPPSPPHAAVAPRQTFCACEQSASLVPRFGETDRPASVANQGLAV
jgi:hypothetical protein